MAQLNLLVGDVEGNTSRIIKAANRAREEFGADLIMLPELAVSGYPPEDLLFHSGLRAQVARSIERLKSEVRGITLVTGYPEYVGDRIFNSAIVMRDGDVLANHRKACLPNYRVFDEKRYFTPGTRPTVLDLNGIRVGILVCEDVWEPEPAAQARAAGAEVLLVINASPYEVNKQSQRECEVVRRRVAETGVPLLFVNLIGGQDELVFDGNSFVMDATRRGRDARARIQGRSLCRRSRGRRARCSNAAAGQYRAASGRRRKRLRCPGAGHARLREQAPIPRSSAGTVRGCRLGPDALHCGRCSRSRSSPFGGNALALHLPDEQGRRRSASFLA